MVIVLIGVAFVVLFVLLPILLLARYLREDEFEAGGSWGRQLLRRRK
jgi:hypothetical protein